MYYSMTKLHTKLSRELLKKPLHEIDVGGFEPIGLEK